MSPIGLGMAAGLVAVAAAWLLTGMIRRYAIRWAILDVPNARSSHHVPTPRGGGLAIVIVVLATSIALGALGRMEWNVVAALAGGGGAVALIGWLDDRQGVRARTRALVQFAAAGWVLWCSGGMPVLTLGHPLDVGALGIVLGAVGIVWSTNLFNFMDGIDGLAGVEAVSVGVIAAVLLAAGDPMLAVASLVIAAASGGFLIWNWAPARIFMGDVGSGFLGFLFGSLAVIGERRGSMPALGWLILTGVFFVDATVTVARRIARGKRWYEAHRSHAYQRAVQAGRTHAQVSGAVALINLGLGLILWFALRKPPALPLALAASGGLLGLLLWAVEQRRPMWPSDADSPRG